MSTDVKAPSRGERTRSHLLDLAEAAFLEKGYAATSIEELIAAAGLTKSGFFYHFEDKLDLGKAVLKRDNDVIRDGLTKIFEEEAAKQDDPLEVLLAALVRYAEAAMASPASRPGCLAAAFSYQQALFDTEVRDLIREGFDFRRAMLRSWLDRIAATRPPRAPIDLDTLADMAISLIQGGIVIDRVRDTGPALRAQMELYRTYLRALFAAPAGK
jgi:AcrR family transcriptional regulator